MSDRFIILRELEELNSTLATAIPAETYRVPAGYFDGLAHQILSRIKAMESSNAKEELEILSPYLGQLSKKEVYSVPPGYFEKIMIPVRMEEKVKARVVSMSPKKWMRYAAAAVITGIITCAALILIYNNQLDPNKNPGVWVEKKVMKKVSADQVDEFVSLASDDDNFRELNSLPEIQPGEIKELMKDVTEEEILHFLNETASTSSDEAEVLLN